MRKLLIAGSRDIKSETKIKLLISDFTNKIIPVDEGLTIHDDLIIISGGARGVDTYAENWAKENSVTSCIYRADWKTGKQAGILRNIKMGEDAHILLAFWDGKSRGTDHMIQYMIAKEKPVRVYILNEEDEVVDSYGDL
jgi:hypothetical protein